MKPQDERSGDASTDPLIQDPCCAQASLGFGAGGTLRSASCDHSKLLDDPAQMWSPILLWSDSSCQWIWQRHRGGAVSLRRHLSPSTGFPKPGVAGPIPAEGTTTSKDA
jgi:hypothetical protein